MLCPVPDCNHDLTLLHDGDGTETDPYRCARCACVFFVEDGDPVVVVED